MSEFIKKMFSEEVERKPFLEKKITEFNMESSVKEQSTPPYLITYYFKALWKMKATGRIEEYDELHAIALKALKREIYGEFAEDIMEINLALYEQDIKKAKNILNELMEKTNL